jgi:hypothetical protein
MRPESKSLIVRGGDLARTLQELRSIHAGHLHVGNNDGKRTVNAKQCQAFFTAGGGGNIEFTSQHSPIGVQHRRFIVDKQYLLIHKFGPSHINLQDASSGFLLCIGRRNRAGRFTHSLRKNPASMRS